MEKKLNICSWRTFKKKNKPKMYYCSGDGLFGSIHLRVYPTLYNLGFEKVVSQAEWGIFENTTPKQLAIELLYDIYGTQKPPAWFENAEFVYNPCYKTGYNDYPEWIEIYRRELL